MKTFLIGGARSGKSALATRRAGELAKQVCCLVTATASDDEMAARIAAHRIERPATWSVREEPVHLAAAVREEDRPGRLLLIDCLTVWTANCMWPAPVAEPDIDHWRRERDDFLLSLRECASDVIIVSNEVGSGIVPESAAARLFRDEHGWLNRVIAAACDEVYLVVAGLPLALKTTS